MLRLLSDENLNGSIVRGLLLRQPDLDLVRIQDVGLRQAEDPEILEWAADHDRILLTHDRATMPDFAYQRLSQNREMPGMFVVNDLMPLRDAIEELLLLNSCSTHDEWSGIVIYLPL